MKYWYIYTMNGPWKKVQKVEETAINHHMLYDFIYTKCLKQANSIETESRLVSARAGDIRKTWGMTAGGYGFLILMMKIF